MTTYIVKVRVNSSEWTEAVREDLYDGTNDEVLDMPAEFDTRAEAEAFIADVRGLMHMGGSAEDFAIEER